MAFIWKEWDFLEQLWCLYFQICREISTFRDDRKENRLFTLTEQVAAWQICHRGQSQQPLTETLCVPPGDPAHRWKKLNAICLLYVFPVWSSLLSLHSRGELDACSSLWISGEKFTVPKNSIVYRQWLCLRSSAALLTWHNACYS